MVNVIRWSSDLEAGTIAFNLRGQTIGGPVGITGRNQVASIDAGYWLATVGLATLDRGDAINAFRALIAESQGGAHHVLVPAFNWSQAPWVSAGGKAANENADSTFTGGFTFTGGYGFYNPAIRVYLAEDAALRATQITVRVDAAGTIKAGMMFSFGRKGLHVIRRVLDTAEATDGDTEYDLAIVPPVREAITEGKRLDFESPVCRMRLVAEDAADIELNPASQAAPSIRFVEAFN